MLNIIIHSKVTEQDLTNLRKLAEQQKSQRAPKIKDRILKEKHDIKFAESSSPITKNLDEVKETIQKLGEVVKKSDVEDGNFQTPAIQNKTATQSLRDTFSFMKRIENFLKLEGKNNGDVFWNKIFVQAKREERNISKDEEYDINPITLAYFTNTKLTTNPLDDEDKLTVFNILKNVGFYSMIHNKGLKSARMQDALYNLPKAIGKFRNSTLPAIENTEDVSVDLHGEGLNFIIPSNINDTYTRLEIFLGLKLSGHTNTLTEASNLIDEIYKMGEIQNEQQYRNALNKISTI